jgi:hypothetical protein
MTRFNSVPAPTTVRRPTMLFLMRRVVDDAAVGNHRVVNLRAVDF